MPKIRAELVPKGKSPVILHREAENKEGQAVATQPRGKQTLLQEDSVISTQKESFLQRHTKLTEARGRQFFFSFLPVLWRNNQHIT